MGSASAARADAGRGGSSGAGRRFDVVVVGGGSAGIAAAASLLRRRPNLRLAVVEPNASHAYQPGWTLVGAGVFERRQTVRETATVMPRRATWLRDRVAAFQPDRNRLALEGGAELAYDALVVAPGLKLDWGAIPGLEEALGHDGVTSNYREDLAPYTWELVKGLQSGNAVFTQPPMPIKCAGAPQKAMYLSCDHWRRVGRLGNVHVEFHSAGAALFGVKEYVPALMEYVERYGIDLRLQSRLVSVDGPARRATFAVKAADGVEGMVARAYDMLHVCPPQVAHDFMRSSPLADAAGWVDVDPETMRHQRFENVFGLGDAGSTANAKTAAAARKQAPVVAENVLATLDQRRPMAAYDGYGSCPLTVERGKIVLAEFGYGGKLLPTFPKAVIDGERPSRIAWLLKERMLPFIYWNGMLKGREWLAAPKRAAATPAAGIGAPAPTR